MNKLLYGLMLFTLMGCSSGELYQRLGSPDPSGPPMRYPLEYPICRGHSAAGTLYVPLMIRVVGAHIPDPMKLMSRRQKNPTDDGCYRWTGPVYPYIEEHDNSSNGFAETLDTLGIGYFSAVSYKLNLLNAEDLRKEAEHEQDTLEVRAKRLALDGKTNANVVLEDEKVLINGLTWRHTLTARYDTYDLSAPPTGPVNAWFEKYEYTIDDCHVLRQSASYNAMVVADTEWIEARRRLLRELVESIRIYPVTPAELAAAREANRRANDD